MKTVLATLIDEPSVENLEKNVTLLKILLIFSSILIHIPFT